jgi:Na+-transporting NADH:ubiquinone oxidoreductase subunit A
MPLQISIRKGLDLPLPGTPEQVVESAKPVRSVAVLGGDYAGLRPKLAVAVGDRVDTGQPLFFDKRDPDVPFVAPGAGSVTAVHRGARRALQSIVIDLDGDTDSPSRRDYAELADRGIERLDTDAIRGALRRSGLWTAFRTRPYSRIPLSSDTPRSVFVTAIDTQPLAGDPEKIVVAEPEAFRKGLAVVARLPEKHVYLCTAPGWHGPHGDGERIRHVEFAGPHPAGLVGTHIHHLDPVGAHRTVWHIGYQDVIAIGKLFGEGRLSFERTIALGGAGFSRPRLVTTRVGADLEELVAGELAGNERTGSLPRLISGSVLNGRAAGTGVHFLGRYHQQITALPEGGERRLFGWFDPVSKAPSFAGLLGRRGRHRGPSRFSTALNGRRTASVPVEAFEHLIPLDILPVPLLRALLVGDTDQAQALGCLELDPEDLALCSFACPGKNDYGAILQAGLEKIEREG